MTNEKFAVKLMESAKTLSEWMSRFNIKDVHVLTGDDGSWYSSDNRCPLIVLDDYSRDARGHEFGHSIFDVVFNKYGILPDCSAIKAKCSEWSNWENRGSAISLYLDIKGRRYNVDRHALGSIADVMGMYLSVDVPNYECHDADYANDKEFINGYADGVNHIYEDEWFANICGLIHEGNWDALHAIHCLYPIAVESCFAIFDKAMEVLKEKAKEMRDKYFITDYTFSCIEIPPHILTLLRTAMLMKFFH